MALQEELARSSFAYNKRSSELERERARLSFQLVGVQREHAERGDALRWAGEEVAGLTARLADCAKGDADASLLLSRCPK